MENITDTTDDPKNVLEKIQLSPKIILQVLLGKAKIDSIIHILSGFRIREEKEYHDDSSFITPHFPVLKSEGIFLYVPEKANFLNSEEAKPLLPKGICFRNTKRKF